MRAFVEEADQEEEGAREDAVVEHDEDRALHAGRVVLSAMDAKMPAVTKPMWLTLEYATSFFRSFCTSETIAP